MLVFPSYINREAEGTRLCCCFTCTLYTSLRQKIINYKIARQMREANILLTAKRSFQMKGFVFCTPLQVPGEMKDTF